MLHPWYSIQRPRGTVAYVRAAHKQGCFEVIGSRLSRVCPYTREALCGEARFGRLQLRHGGGHRRDRDGVHARWR
jgi:hypothetical protein